MMKPDHAEAIAKIQLLRGDVAISVDLSWCILDDAALECLKGLPQLQELYLSHTEVTDAGLEHLKGLRQLQTLDLGGTNVTDAGLEHLKDLPLLQTLDLSNAEVTDAGLEHLKDLLQLQTLDLSGARVTDAGLERLQAFRQLQELGLSGTEVTDAGLEHLRGLPELEGLCFWATGAGLKHLRGLPRLRELDLGGTKVTDAGLKHLKGLRQLQSLSLTGTEVTDAGLEHLKGLKQLRTLDLTLTRVKGPLDPTEWESQGPQFVGLDVGTVPQRAVGLDRGQANEQLRHETQARRQTEEQSRKEQQHLRYLLEVNENLANSDDFSDLCRWTEEKARFDGVGTALLPEDEEPEAERRLLHSQRLESLGILASSIAHDLSNILAGIMGYADLAKVHLPSPDLVRNDIEVIRSAVGRATDLTRQMLAHSGKGKLIVEQVSLSEAVKDIREMVEISISKKAMLKYNLTSHLPTIQANASQIHQVILNLVINASEALGEDGGVIVISTDSIRYTATDFAAIGEGNDLREGLYVRLEVTDTGCGIDEETLEKIFDPFFTTKFRGRGLGLAAVHRIARGYKGVIRVASKPGKGTTFQVLFPASNTTAPFSARESIPAKPGRCAGTA